MTAGHRRPDATGGELLALSLSKFQPSPVLIKNEHRGIKISTFLCSKPDFQIQGIIPLEIFGFNLNQNKNPIKL